MKKLISLVGFVVCALTAPSAMAGDRAGNNVFGFNWGTEFLVYGTTGTAYNAANFTESIGCRVRATRTGISMGCDAYDAAGNYFYCSSSAPSLVTAAGTVTGDSDIEFQYFTASHECSTLTVRKGSWTEPKH